MGPGEHHEGQQIQIQDLGYRSRQPSLLIRVGELNGDEWGMIECSPAKKALGVHAGSDSEICLHIPEGQLYLVCIDRYVASRMRE